MAESDVLAAIAALPTDADVQAAVAAALLVYDPPAATNLCTNPSCELMTGGMANGWGDYGTKTGTAVWTEAAGRLSGKAQRYQYTGVAGDAAGKTCHPLWYGVAGEFAATENAMCSIYVKGSVSGVTQQLQIVARNSVGGYLGAAYGALTLTSSWQRVSLLYPNLPAGTSFISFGPYLSAIVEGDTVDLTFDDYLGEKSAVLNSYFDGSYLNCAWAAAANASTSIRLARAQVIAELKTQVAAVWTNASRSLTDRSEFTLSPAPLAFMWSGPPPSEISADLATIRAAGIDVLFSYRTGLMSDAEMLSYLDALDAAGLRTMLDMMFMGKVVASGRGEKTLTTGELADLTAYIDKWKTHPAVWGWYADDEGGAEYPIATRQQVYDTIKAAHPAGQVVECGFLLNDGAYSPDVHDVFAMDAGTTGAAYVYYWDDEGGCVSRDTGLCTNPTMEAALLADFGANLTALRAELVAAGETNYFVVMQAFGQGPEGTNHGRAMPPPGSLMKMWSEVKNAGWSTYGIGWFAWKADDAVTMPGESLDGVGESAYANRQDEISAIAASFASPLSEVASSLSSQLDDVLLKTNTIGSLAVTVTSPVAASGTITVYSGDDYASADSRAITVTIADTGHMLGLDEAVVKLKATQATWEAADVVSTTDGYTVTFEATAAQTAAVTRAQRYELEATLANGHVVTLAKGSLVTRTDISAVAAP